MLLTAMTILMESCTSEGSLLQLVLLLWPKIDRVDDDFFVHQTLTIPPVMPLFLALNVLLDEESS